MKEQKLFEFGDIIMHEETKKITIISADNQSFSNVFRAEYIYLGNVDTKIPNKTFIYEKFIEQTNIKQQLLQSVEEMAELQKEILKLIRYGMNGSAKVLTLVKEELGDVYNALDSLVQILEIDTDELDKERYIKLIKYYNKIV
jgi:NTP pyrophosphatase (non-canonical NTP hydrolase)